MGKQTRLGVILTIGSSPEPLSARDQHVPPSPLHHLRRDGGVGSKVHILILGGPAEDTRPQWGSCLCKGVWRPVTSGKAGSWSPCGSEVWLKSRETGGNTQGVLGASRVLQFRGSLVGSDQCPGRDAVLGLPRGQWVGTWEGR